MARSSFEALIHSRQFSVSRFLDIDRGAMAYEMDENRLTKLMASFLRHKGLRRGYARHAS